MIGAGMSAGTMIPWAILPSITDVDEMITTQRRAGIYAGIMSFIRQLVQALTLFGFSQALFFIGYVANTQQSPETLFKLKTMFFLAPFTLIICGIIVAFKFGITPQTHDVLMKEIHRLKEGGAMADVMPETRQVCETLTGQPYEKLYKKWD
jgi:oligogalacturonide transporter